jgi:isochorismate synthase
LIFIKKVKQESQNFLCTLQKPDNIKVVGYFQKNDHLYFAENFEEAGFFLPFEGSQMILIPLISR